MPFSAIQLRPGVNTVATQTLNQAGISLSNLIRFRDGLVEKMGGWARYITTSMGSTVRDLHAWQDLNQNKWLASGSLLAMNVILNNSVTNITPTTFLSNSSSVNITTAQGSRSITIIDAGINTLISSDSVFFNTPIAVGGLILAGSFQIVGTPVGTSYTITSPFPATSNVANGGAVPVFTTTAGSSIVNVLLTSHGLTTGSAFVFPIATVVGGLTISGSYSSVNVLDNNNFTVTATQQAVSSATASMNGGNASYLYNITTGPALASQSGALGAIGELAIGQGFAATTSTSVQTGTPITASDWTIDNWGEILLACPRGGSIWYWPPSSGFPTMLSVGNGPKFNNGIFVAMPQQILVAWGSTSSLRNASTDGSIDPLIVRWSDQLNFLVWTVTSQTQAGSFHIPTGSEIRGAIQAPQQALIFTDLDCWSMQYLGPPLVFGFNQIGNGCGLVGPHAVANLYGRTYWMGNTNFFVTTGQGVQEVPCTVWDNVFQDFDIANQSKCVAAPNSSFNEIMFFYPSISGGTGECDKYAKLNVIDGSWDYGSLPRSAWVDTSVLGNPIGADSVTNLLQSHEHGYDDDGSVMDSFFETGYFAYGDAEQFSILDYFEPDMKWKTVNGSTSASIQVTLTAAPSPNGPTMISGPLTVTSTTAYVTPRLRGRQIKWRQESTDLGSWWRIGNTRYRFAPDGRR